MESITDELREWAHGNVQYKSKHERLTAIADRIDAEHEAQLNDAFETRNSDENLENDGWVRLPLDAEGVPIHVGDKLEFVSYGGTKTEYTALGYWYDFDCDVLQVLVSNSHAISGNCLRHHAPTVEDVLLEFAAEVETAGGVMELPDAALSEYAAKLRLAEGSE